jgi:pimeloyl-ACP methyl ester carboxylesterase
MTAKGPSAGFARMRIGLDTTRTGLPWPEVPLAATLHCSWGRLEESPHWKGKWVAILTDRPRFRQSSITLGPPISYCAGRLSQTALIPTSPAVSPYWAEWQVKSWIRKWKDFASPANYVSADDPPLLIFQGDSDRTVLPDQSERIAKLYADAGLTAELVIIEGAGHGGRRFYHGEHFEQAKRFLTSARPA